MPDPFPPFQRHSETSRAAASAFADRAPTARARVLHLLTGYPYGLTDHEIGSKLDLPGNTVRPRRVELVREGSVLPVMFVVAETKETKPRTRRAPGHRAAQVWVARGHADAATRDAAGRAFTLDHRPDRRASWREMAAWALRNTPWRPGMPDPPPALLQQAIAMVLTEHPDWRDTPPAPPTHDGSNRW